MCKQLMCAYFVSAPPPDPPGFVNRNPNKFSIIEILSAIHQLSQLYIVNTNLKPQTFQIGGRKLHGKKGEH